jgi:hypothetical protein
MFCPKCGDELVRKDGVWSCIAGGDGFSELVDGILNERFGNHSPSPHHGARPKDINVVRVPLRDGGHEIVPIHPYYCPGCGVVLSEDMVCPECGISIRDLLFHLVERFSHR